MGKIRQKLLPPPLETPHFWGCPSICPNDYSRSLEDIEQKFDMYASILLAKVKF